jgi:hypothetical protein
MRYPLAAVVAISLLAVVVPEWARAQQATKPLVLIASKDMGISDLPLAAVRRAFGGELTDVSGKRLTPLNYVPGDPVRVAFDKVVLKLLPAQVGRFWIDRRIRGQSLPPKTVPSPRVMRSLVAILGTKLGAIGYVSVDELDGTVQPLKIDGRSHTDAGYPLMVAASDVQ